MKKYISIAIDGPSGSGKSTAAKELAKKLGFLYINTGLMYRAYAYFLSINKLDINVNEIDSINAIKNADFIFNGDNVKINGKDVSLILRSNDVAMIASVVSANEKIRNLATNEQRRIASENNVVMDGRDIGSIVLTNADLKFYLNTSIQTRAKRRLFQNKDIENLDYESIYNDIKERDRRDMTRKIAPLKKANDAVEIFNDNMKLDECVQHLYEIYLKKIKKLNF
ncbi:(d)CMP kinase [Ureaplasma parvum]|uniref:(d)CMP kinase n=1 Tax=Ureaplasma parvum TaxID=134821 RepID=UPI0026EA1D94|nr:(d)CMP kinase [Ureaplasma parvum]